MRKIVLLVMFCFLTCLAACGGEDEKVIENNKGTVENIQQTENNSENINENKNDNEQTQTADAVTKKNGYVYAYNGIEVEIDADANTYVQAFGEPSSYYETPSCAFDNLDKFYTYQGFEIDTYYSNGKDLVLSVVLLDDTVSTVEGVCIGDAQSKVASVYGDPTESTDNSATYRKDNMKLVFIFKDGAVAAIEYSSLVLETQ